MLYHHLTALRWLLPASFLLVSCSQGQNQAESAVAAPEQPTQTSGTQQPAAAESMPKLLGGQGEEAVLQAIQDGIVLPFGTAVPDTSSRVVVSFVVDGLGSALDEKIVQGYDSAVDEAVLTAVRGLPRFEGTVRNGKHVPVPCTLTVKAPGVATAAQRQEADTRWRQAARRLPGETDSSFVRRVLPLSSAYDFKLMTHAWRPSAFGKQLFFAQLGVPGNEYGTDLFVLDPYQPDTYAVQVIPIETMGDLTNLAALFFADANHDGRKDMLTLAVCALSETRESDDGEMLPGHWNHYRTDVWQYAGPDQTGRPQYRQDLTPRPYLDELPTAAEVRQALTRHQARPKRAE